MQARVPPAMMAARMASQEEPVKRLGPILLTALAAACASAPETTVHAVANVASAAETITADDLMRHISALASDRFEGRSPGTPGEDSTVAYLTRELQRMGLKPGNPDGTYVQQVPLVGITSRPTTRLIAGGRELRLRFPDDYVAVSRRVEPRTAVSNSQLVFVGYGVVAPEHGWDDFKDVDVRGKTLVMFVNDPPIPDPSNPAQLDTSMFRGRTMTYYGRWTYKYEIATSKGAAGAIIVHETGPAGYPYEVVKGSWGAENFDIVSADRNMSRVPVEGWITEPKARELFASVGQDFDDLKERALRRDFRPIPLDATVSFQIDKTMRETQSRNVVARLEGSDPARRDEHVIYTAHWDHLGRNASLSGDQIYNGAIDNATGTSMVLEIAEAYSRLRPAPPRSALFLLVTAEEQGLLGAKYYAQNPLYPLEKTLANINLDAMYPWGPTRDVIVIGYGNTTLDDVLAARAAEVGRTLTPDQEPEKGRYYRSDHFEFGKVGVPALYPKTGNEFVGQPADFGARMRARYDAEDYHKPSDEVKPEWDLSGLAADAALFFRVGVDVAHAPVWPEWKPGTEFKAVREEMLRNSRTNGTR